MFDGPWSDPKDLGPLDNRQRPKLKIEDSSDVTMMEEDLYSYSGPQLGLWPWKRRLSERDVAFNLKTYVGLGSYLNIMGSRRDVITTVWRIGLDGVVCKSIRCLRQTCAFAQPRASNPTNDKEAWWISGWIHGCTMCGGTWVRVV